MGNSPHKEKPPLIEQVDQVMKIRESGDTAAALQAASDLLGSVGEQVARRGILPAQAQLVRVAVAVSRVLGMPISQTAAIARVCQPEADPDAELDRILGWLVSDLALLGDVPDSLLRWEQGRRSNGVQQQD